MPVILSTLIIFIAAIGGYCLSVLFIRALFRPYSPKNIAGFRVHGIIPAILPQVAKYASGKIEEKFLSEELIATKLSDPALMQELKPAIEDHIDEFLKVKLKEAFPLLSNFMGEKTLKQFKAVFLTEVEEILPILLKNNAGKLANQLQPEKLLSEELNNIKMSSLENMMKKHAKRQITLFYLAGAILGGIVGIIQVLIIYFIKFQVIN